MKRSDLYEKAGLNLKIRRQELKLRQADVAKLTGISRPSLANIEAGKQAMTMHLFYKISSVLNVSDAKSLLPAGVVEPKHVDQPIPVKINSTAKSKLNKEQIAMVTQVLNNSGGKR